MTDNENILTYIEGLIILEERENKNSAHKSEVSKEKVTEKDTINRQGD